MWDIVVALLQDDKGLVQEETAISHIQNHVVGSEEWDMGL